ncbi:hypothetical protein JAAARDRAFT_42537, partial [Jaapia argillacea MUCL 33604]
LDRREGELSDILAPPQRHLSTHTDDDGVLDEDKVRVWVQMVGVAASDRLPKGAEGYEGHIIFKPRGQSTSQHLQIDSRSPRSVAAQFEAVTPSWKFVGSMGVRNLVGRP